MSETANPSPAQPQPPQEFHWGIAYLREDIQTLRQDMHQTIQGVRQEVQGVRQEVRENVHELRQEIRFTNTRIDEKYELLSKRLDSQFRWFMTTIVTIGGILVALSGVIISTLKP